MAKVTTKGCLPDTSSKQEVSSPPLLFLPPLKRFSTRIQNNSWRLAILNWIVKLPTQRCLQFSSPQARGDSYPQSPPSAGAQTRKRTQIWFGKRRSFPARQQGAQKWARCWVGGFLSPWL